MTSKNYVRLLWAAALCLVFAYGITIAWWDLATIRVVNWSSLIWASVLTVVLLILNSLINQAVIVALGYALPLSKALQSSIINGLTNLVSPVKGGIISSAIYLKTESSVSYHASLLANLVGFVGSCWAMCLVSAVFVSYKQGFSSESAGLYFGFAGIAFAPFLLGIVVKAVPVAIQAKINPQLLRLGLKLKSHHRLYLLVMAASLGAVAATTFIFMFLFQAIGDYVDLDTLVAFSAIALISSLSSVMPFSLGARELLLVGFAGALQRPAVTYVVVSLLERVISFGVNMALFALILVRLGGERKAKMSSRKGV